MGMPLPKGGKVNMGAVQGQMKQNIRSAKTKERLQAKLQKRRAAAKEHSSKDEQIRLLQQQITTLRAQYK